MRPPKAPLGSVVLVRWSDAAGAPGWHDTAKLSSVAGLEPVVSSGFLVHRNGERIVLSSAITRDGYAGNCFSIPLSQVTDVKVVRKPDKTWLAR